MGTGTVADIPDEKLLERAVRGARDHTMPSRHKHPRWTAVRRDDPIAFAGLVSLEVEPWAFGTRHRDSISRNADWVT